MNAYVLKRYIKVVLFLLASLIALLTLMLSNRLVKRLAEEERKKVALWAEAQRRRRPFPRPSAGVRRPAKGCRVPFTSRICPG